MRVVRRKIVKKNGYKKRDSDARKKKHKKSDGDYRRSETRRNAQKRKVEARGRRVRVRAKLLSPSHAEGGVGCSSVNAAVEAA